MNLYALDNTENLRELNSSNSEANGYVSGENKQYARYDGENNNDPVNIYSDEINK